MLNSVTHGYRLRANLNFSRTFSRVTINSALAASVSARRFKIGFLQFGAQYSQAINEYLHTLPNTDHLHMSVTNEFG